MVILRVNQLRKQYGAQPVLQGASLELRRGERAGLIGPNGAGKTTLLRIIGGQEDPDGGVVELAGGVHVGVLPQHPSFPAGQTVWDAAADALADLAQLAREADRTAQALAAAADNGARRRLAERFDRLQAELHRRDGYHLRHRIERVLHGLGFGTDMFRLPAERLSGGQQNRLLLARLLLQAPDLLLLDEPSNHLDLRATQWLEDELVRSRRALIVVSHDRYFLDRVTERTLELVQGQIESYPGGFSAYQRQKAERLDVQRRTYERQRAEIAKMEEFIRRHHYGQKHAQAEDRRKKLQRIKLAPPPREIAAPPMGLPEPARTGDVVLRVEGLSKAFDRPLFRDLSFDIQRGETWGVMGPNGCGKTTLLRCIAGQLAPDAGRIVLGAGVAVGYFDQLLAQQPPEATVLDLIRPPGQAMSQQQRRDLLARFGVTGDAALQPVARLSGGQRSRAALAALAASRANFLLLDEPTNHLDLWARDALERTLQQYAGTVLLVSHDRYFLNRVVDHLLVAEHGRFRVIHGNYDTYAALAAAEAKKQEPADAATQPRPTPPQRKPPTSARRPPRRFPYRKLDELEADIRQREQRLDELHQLLADPATLRDGARVKRLKAELEQIRQRLDQLYAHWEEAVELDG